MNSTDFQFGPPIAIYHSRGESEKTAEYSRYYKFRDYYGEILRRQSCRGRGANYRAPADENGLQKRPINIVWCECISASSRLSYRFSSSPAAFKNRRLHKCCVMESGSYSSLAPQRASPSQAALIAGTPRAVDCPVLTKKDCGISPCRCQRDGMSIVLSLMTANGFSIPLRRQWMTGWEGKTQFL